MLFDTVSFVDDEAVLVKPQDELKCMFVLAILATNWGSNVEVTMSVLICFSSVETKTQTSVQRRKMQQWCVKERLDSPPDQLEQRPADGKKLLMTW